MNTYTTACSVSCIDAVCTLTEHRILLFVQYCGPKPFETIVLHMFIADQGWPCRPELSVVQLGVCIAREHSEKI